MSIFVIIYFLFIIWTFFLFIYFFFWNTDRNHYYIKVVENIQFVCAGNSGISRVLCNANTYRFIHEGLFFNSSPALRLPYIHFYFSSLQLQYKINGIHWMAFINISTNQIDSYILVVCQTTRPADNSDHSKGLVGP